MPDLLTGTGDYLQKIIYSVLVLLVTVLLRRATKRLLWHRDAELTNLETLRMLVRNGILVLGTIAILAIWLGFSSSFTVAMGIMGAGIAFTSQEVIGSLAGYLVIVTSNLYHIGDRIQVGNIVGDVLDIHLMRTTVMEIGEWVEADQYTGRVVSIANRAVFSDAVVNYTQTWPYIWDEVMIPITYESDWKKAAEIIMDHGEEYTADLQEHARETLHQALRRYPAIQETTVAPALYTIMTDNWIEMTLRYVVDPRERRGVKNQLHRELLVHFQQAKDITIASATFEVVGLPTLKLRSEDLARD